MNLTVYVVDRTPDKIGQFVEGRARAAARLGLDPVPPGTLLGVAALDVPEHLVELEVTAVLDRRPSGRGRTLSSSGEKVGAQPREERP